MPITTDIRRAHTEEHLKELVEEFLQRNDHDLPELSVMFAGEKVPAWRIPDLQISGRPVDLLRDGTLCCTVERPIHGLFGLVKRRELTHHKVSIGSEQFEELFDDHQVDDLIAALLVALV